MAIIKHAQQRVGVLIDAQNLYHSAQNLYGKRVNFTEILKESVAGRQLIRSIAYVITSEAGDEKTFFEALEKAGIETKTKDLQIFYGGAKKADWDVGIAVDGIKLAPHLDALVIASGDGDFIPMIQYVQQNSGCQVEVISFGRSTSANLIEAADDFIDMCADTKKYLMNSRVARSHNQRKVRARKAALNPTSNSNAGGQKPQTQASEKPTEQKIEAQPKSAPKKRTTKKTTTTKPTAKTVKKK